jgi:hypothetical protein
LCARHGHYVGGESPLGKPAAVTPSQSQGDKPATSRSDREVGAEGSEARSCESTNRKRVGGADGWGERAKDREAPAAKNQAA